MLIGADYYESEEQRRALFEAGRIPMGIGENSVISNTIVDKNARIGKNCRIINKDGIEEANREARPCLGSRRVALCRLLQGAQRRVKRLKRCTPGRHAPKRCSALPAFQPRKNASSTAPIRHSPFALQESPRQNLRK